MAVKVFKMKRVTGSFTAIAAASGCPKNEGRGMADKS
jgi:hypothetical protein